MGEVNQGNVHLLLPWKVAGVAELWARDIHVTPLEALMRFYSTKFYRQLEDESSKLWCYSPNQLYYLFTHSAA